MELAILMKLCIVIYIWMEQCVWMELAYVWTMCMDETDVICDMWYETYVLDMCWICDMKLIYFLCKLWDLTKNRKNRQYAGSLPSATDGKEPLPSAADGKEATWQPTVLPGSWPIWSVCLQWQTAKTLSSVADGKEPALCHQWQTAKNLPSSDV